MTLFGIEILTGFNYIFPVYCGFALVYLLNIMGGIIVNCQVEKREQFCLSKLFLSLEKIVFCAIVITALTISTNLVTQGLFSIQPELTEMVTSIVSIGVFALVFAKGFIQKALDLVSKIKFILEIQDTSEEPDLTEINAATLDNLPVAAELEPSEIEPLG